MQNPETPDRLSGIESAHILFQAWHRVSDVTSMLDAAYWDGRVIYDPTDSYNGLPLGTQITASKAEDMWWVHVEHPGFPSMPAQVWGLDPNADDVGEAVHYYEISIASGGNEVIRVAELGRVDAKKKLSRVADYVYRLHQQEAAFLLEGAEIIDDERWDDLAPLE